ncbi:hypothetical protein C8R47DRAFT_57940 [Mycena vitilis]|nr:hypothetical protein C8R47DRAFT_57940 [Mycena vitilis]
MGGCVVGKGEEGKEFRISAEVTSLFFRVAFASCLAYEVTRCLCTFNADRSATAVHWKGSVPGLAKRSRSGYCGVSRSIWYRTMDSRIQCIHFCIHFVPLIGLPFLLFLSLPLSAHLPARPASSRSSSLTTAVIPSARSAASSARSKRSA